MTDSALGLKSKSKGGGVRKGSNIKLNSNANNSSTSNNNNNSAGNPVTRRSVSLSHSVTISDSKSDSESDSDSHSHSHFDSDSSNKIGSSNTSSSINSISNSNSANSSSNYSGRAMPQPNRYIPFLLLLFVSGLLENWNYTLLPSPSSSPSLTDNALANQQQLNLLNQEISPHLIGSHMYQRPTDEFRTANAFRHLQKLSSFGPRVTGSTTNEITTPDWLYSELKIIAAASASAGVTVDIDLQHPSGNFYLDFLGGITNVYREVTNVVVKVSWPQTAHKEGILINAHFDSVPGSPGTSDDGVGVAVMLEIIRSITSKDSKPLDYPIVFLFNGAEEWNHQAAHGFITQHAWSSEVQYVLNLESIGAGGREVMFQCNSGYVAQLYGKVTPHPYASVMAHEMFKYFLFRFASTDWMTLLKYGKHRHMRGMDTAYTTNGYVYHTSFDSIGAVPNGTIQNTGENMLQLIKALGDYHIKSTVIPDDTNSLPESQDEYAVFFDVYTYFLIVYTGQWVPIIHSLIVAFGLFTVYFILKYTNGHFALRLVKQAVVDEGYCVFVTVMSILGASVFAWLFMPMRWYDGGLTLMMVMFYPPLLLGQLYSHGEIASKSYSKCTLRQIGCLCCFLCIAIPMILMKLASAFVYCMWVLAISISMWIYYFTRRFIEEPMKKNLSATTTGGGSKAIQIPYYFTADFAFLFSLVPVILIFHRINHSLFDMMIPLLGKSGTIVPSDVILAIVFAFTHSLPTSIIMANEIQRPLHKKWLQRGIAGLFVLYGIIGLSSFGYSKEHPKRLWIHHLERRYQYKPANGLPNIPTMLSTYTTVQTEDGYQVATDSGLWVLGFDSQGLSPLHSHLLKFHEDRQDQQETVSSYDLYLKSKEVTHCDVTNGDCYHAFPWYFPVAEVLRDSIYFPISSHKPLEERAAIGEHETMKLMVTPHEVLQTEKRIIEIELFGPSHMHLVLRERNMVGNQITRWYLGDEDNDNSQPIQMDKILSLLELPSPIRSEGMYVMEIGFGLCSAHKTQCRKRVWVESTRYDPIEITAYGHYVDKTDDQAIQDFLQVLPSWSKGAEWTKFPSVLISEVV